MDKLYSELQEKLRLYRMNKDRAISLANLNKFLQENKIDFEPYKFEGWVEVTSNDEGGSRSYLSSMKIYNRQGQSLEAFVKSSQVKDEEGILMEYDLDDYILDCMYYRYAENVCDFTVDDIVDYNLALEVQNVLENSKIQA